jgi:enoyl-CoA hydratase/carnithine racemase
MSDELLVERREHVAILTLNRPERMNAMTTELAGALHDTLGELEDGFPEVRAIVLTGAGRGFCSGMDTRHMAQQAASGVREVVPPGRHIPDVVPHIRRMPQPVIAAVNGPALGAGFAFVLASDLRIASEEARFGTIFINRSIGPGAGSSNTLVSAVGPTVAAEVFFTGRIYDAVWAQRVGLVSSVVEASRLLPEALALAEEIASKPPLAIRLTKELMHRTSTSLEQVLEWEAEVNSSLNSTEDYREALTAYVEKRDPVYHGR